MTEDKESSILLQASHDAERTIFGTLSDFCFKGTGTLISQYSADSVKENLLNLRSPLMEDFMKSVGEKYCTSGGHILDVGCGAGGDSALMVSLGHKVVSCDYVEDMVKIARSNKEYLIEKGDNRFENWEIFQGDITSLKQTVEANPEIPQQYDCITSFGGVIAYLQDDDVMKAFKNLFALLKPGGALVFDHRNFLPAIEKGHYNRRGHNPNNHTLYSSNTNTGALEVKPYIVYEPAPGRKPIAVFHQFILNNGETTYVTLNPMSPNKVTSMAKAVFGEECNIIVLHDLLSETEVPEIDACFITYIIERPIK